MSKVGNIATACINQYRSRDIFAYLGLRYCLEFDAAKSDLWAETNATQAVFAKKEGSYLRSYHFKQIGVDGVYEDRDIFVPSIPEALSEIVLLRRCAELYNTTLSNRVFSYRLDTSNSSAGTFDPFMKGLQERQEQIAKACRSNPENEVLYIDIKKFYPSISPDIARSAWLLFSQQSGLDEYSIDLGNKLLDNHALRSGESSILTGPMFSHFVANLVLREVDEYAITLGVEYFRYVDDITVVGSTENVETAIHALRDFLKIRGFDIHAMDSSKTLRLSAQDWLDSSNDFSPATNSIAWMRLVGDIKKFLIFDSGKSGDLEDALLVIGARLPIPDYGEAVKEVSSYSKIKRLGLWNWLRFKTKTVTVDTIVSDVDKLAQRLFLETTRILAEPGAQDGYERKRAVSQLRYRLGRLLLLGKEELLEELVVDLTKWPELTYHNEIIKAIISQDCSNIVSMGSNVSQAVAQIFRPSLKTARFSRVIKGEKETQGLAVFILNGIPVEAQVANVDHPILRFARGPIDMELMSSPRGLLQEIACLHGLGDARHSSILRTAFDLDENMIFDALEMDYGYSL